MIVTRTLPTYTATIWVGTWDRDRKIFIEEKELFSAVGGWCSRVKQGITVTDTWFAYVDGGEPGYAIGFIDYPRFPLGREEIRRRALELAALLKQVCHQHKVSVVFPDDTVMLIDEEELAT